MLSIAALMFLAGAGDPPRIPQSKTCPDGTVVLASDTCPPPRPALTSPAAPAKPERATLTCEAYVSPALALPTGYPRVWTISKVGMAWTASAGAVTYSATQTGQRELGLSTATFRDATGGAVSYRFVGILTDDSKRRVLAEIGPDARPPLSYLCTIAA